MVGSFGTSIKAFSFVYCFSSNQILDEHEARNETHRNNVNEGRNTGANVNDLQIEQNISDQLANFSDGPERHVDYGMLLSSFLVGSTFYYCN